MIISYISSFLHSLLLHGHFIGKTLWRGSFILTVMFHPDRISIMCKCNRQNGEWRCICHKGSQRYTAINSNKVVRTLDHSRVKYYMTLYWKYRFVDTACKLDSKGTDKLSKINILLWLESSNLFLERLKS